jgi:hypothetical protein
MRGRDRRRSGSSRADHRRAEALLLRLPRPSGGSLELDRSRPKMVVEWEAGS